MKHGLQQIGTIFSKELVDNLRDRRSLVSSSMSALIGPVLTLLLIIIVGKSVFQEDAEKKLRIPIVGAENGKALVQFLEQNGAEVEIGPLDPKNEVRNGNLDLVLVISDDFSEKFLIGEPAGLQLVIDPTRQSAIASIEKARKLIQAYASQIAILRLQARGIDPQVVSPLVVEQVDVSTPQSQAVLFLAMMPYFMVMVVFLGGMYVIIDTTAGERERGSLEPLLTNPVRRSYFVLGKIAASIPFALFTVILTLAAFAAAFNLFPLEDYLGFQMTLDIGSLVNIFLITLPMILLASALQMIVATFTRSYKEAQTYVAFLPLIPALPGIGLSFMTVKSTVWTMLIPTFGQQVLINQLMRGEAVSLEMALLSAFSTIVASILLIVVAIRLYQHERILFGSR